MIANLRKSEGDTHVIDVNGRIDAANAVTFQQEMEEILTDLSGRVVLNLEKMDYTSSAGLRIFLSLAKKAKTAGNQLKICCMNPNVYKIFKLAGFVSLLDIVDDEAAALQ